jgi:hypothetical protein
MEIIGANKSNMKIIRDVRVLTNDLHLLAQIPPFSKH